MNGRFGVTRFGVHVATGVLCMMGCASTPPREDIDEVAQAFGVSSCSTATADQVFTGFIPSFVTPQTYNTCFRGYVVDVLGTRERATVAISWRDAVPTTQAACEKTWGAFIFYRKVGDTWVDQTGVAEGYGIWVNAARPFCSPPRFELGVEANQNYRVAATMRPRYGSSELRAIGYDWAGGSGGGGGISIGGTSASGP